MIGAIFLDSSYSETKTVLDKLFIDDFIRLDEDKELKDSKSILQELIQKQYKSLPRYSVNQESSNKQNNYFEVSCFVDEENLTAQGTGKTIKRAELNAASNMLALIKV